MGNKVKDVEKCKHPNSRKTIALAKQLKKVAKKNKAKHDLALKQNIIGEKYAWFKERLDENCESCTAEQTENLINEYISRFDDELEQIQMKHSIGMRKNRQHANREDVIKLAKKRELEEFNTCGIEIPDIMDPKNVDTLKKWNGELRFLQNLKLRRFNKKFLEGQKIKHKDMKAVKIVKKIEKEKENYSKSSMDVD